ncbi:MAG TPA: serine/threonine protein kinase [Desulfobulbaceae bacterium]|nr:serine/threonine protein kinase [Desulfobulbaceae bacterium]
MNRAPEPPSRTVLQALNPDLILTLVEKALGVRCTNLCRPLASYINRVYELEAEDHTGIIVKFYRPGRWSTAALQDEHDFLLELAAQEVPVIPPFRLLDGTTLGSHQGMHFALFPKCGGRSFDEYNDDQWLELGRLLGRTHAVGSTHASRERITLAPDRSTRDQVEYILRGGFIPRDLRRAYEELTGTLIAEISPLFAGTEMIRIHGDCHFANLIHRPGESFYLIDFDDMAIGPPVQDFWMLLPDYADQALVEIDLFLEGYETFRAFDRRTLKLIEPLRAMRFIHYSAWCAHQVAEDGASPVIPDFGTPHYWQREIKDLSDQLARIRTAPEQSTGNIR